MHAGDSSIANAEAHRPHMRRRHSAGDAWAIVLLRDASTGQAHSGHFPSLGSPRRRYPQEAHRALAGVSIVVMLHRPFGFV